MTRQPQAELWRLVQSAWDHKRKASEDEAVLDWLVQHPEMAGEMDEVLVLESQLQVLASAEPRPGRRGARRIAYAALIAATLLAIWAPSLWDGIHRSASDDTVQVGPEAKEPTHSTSVASRSTRAQPPLAVATILSFELEIENQRPLPGATESTERFADSDPPQVTIHTLTSTRTRSPPRGAHWTF